MRNLEKALRRERDSTRAAIAAAQRFAETAGKAADIAYTTVDSPIGDLTLATTHQGLLRIGFDNESGVLEGLADKVSPQILDYPARLAEARRELDEYFAGRRNRFTLPLDWALIDGFRRRVLTATYEIPYGAVSTYQEVARRVGQPKGARATGQALGGNPIPLIIPCHRILQSGGGLGGYAGGTDRKEYLLRLEGAVL
jgi:methylated-DNA-[protein]-cysteine S-methyltransferase